MFTPATLRFLQIPPQLLSMLLCKLTFDFDYLSIFVRLLTIFYSLSHLQQHAARL